MRAVLRRSPADQAGELSSTAITVGDVALDPDEHRVMIRHDLVPLPLKEFELLHLLLANAGRVLTRETLIDRVWGSDYVGDTKTLDVHVKRLRTKVETTRRSRPASSPSAASATSTSARRAESRWSWRPPLACRT
jgi:two-component system, OmpR family, response regulator RegX3